MKVCYLFLLKSQAEYIQEEPVQVAETQHILTK